ncbi:hypothetical protein [Paenibacillus sp. SI8]|uniref:hypothetical protein n=1 Tax=unclassified Paenibacillus TaxID=185978 RepID=UPI003467C5A4
MIQKLTQQLAAAKEKGRLQKVWMERLDDLEKELNRQKQHITLLENQLRQEEKDVARLKGSTFTSFLYGLLDKKQKKLAAEEKELLEAKFRYDEAIHQKVDIRNQISEIKEKLDTIRFWDLEVNELTKKIEAHIHTYDSGKSQQLKSLADIQVNVEGQVQELHEAMSAGKTVAGQLAQALEILTSARNWGKFDILGGGILSTHIKNEKIDEAMNHIRFARSSLSRFQKELCDVRVTLDMDINISDFLRFSDYFFDGFISDWLVQDKINATISQIENKLREVNRIRNALEQRYHTLQLAVAETKREYDSVLSE